MEGEKTIFQKCQNGSSTVMHVLYTKNAKKAREGLDLLNVVVGVGVDGPVKAVELVVDETDICNVEDPGGAHMENLRELEGDGLFFNIVAHTRRGDTMETYMERYKCV